MYPLSISRRTNFTVPFLPFLILILLLQGCDTTSVESELSEETSRGIETYSVQAYARDVSALLAPIPARARALPKATVMSLRAAVKQAEAAQQSEDPEVVKREISKLHRLLTRHVFMDGELKTLEAYGQRLIEVQPKRKALSEGKIHAAFGKLPAAKTDCEDNCAINLSVQVAAAEATWAGALWACGTTGPGWAACVGAATIAKYAAIAAASVNAATCADNCQR